jgi:hypothetical protein
MKSFKFNQTSNENFDQILKYRERKVAKQQIIFFALLVVIGVILGVYLYKKLVYTVFDGYVTSDVRQYRAPEDIFLKNLYVKVGSFVVPGDTLYSFAYIKALNENKNINTEPDVVAKSRDIHLRIASVQAEINVLQVTISNLRKQIETERYNVRLGLSSNAHVLDLERELKKEEEELRGQYSVLAALNSERASLAEGIAHTYHSFGFSVSLHNIMVDTLGLFDPFLEYRVATDSAIVTKITTVEGMCMAHMENIMCSFSLNTNYNNFGVWVYIPLDKIDKVKRGDPVDVVFNDDYVLKGHFGIIGVRTEELPQNLRSNFDRQTRVSIAHVEIDEGQDVPLWMLADNDPVKVIVTNFRMARKQGHSQLHFKVGNGLTPESKIYFDSVVHQPSNFRRIHCNERYQMKGYNYGNNGNK